VNKTAKVIIGVLAVALLGLGVAFYTSQVARPPLGATSGTEHYNVENFYSGFTNGGASYTIRTAHNCATSSWNPGSLSTSTVGNATTTDIALTGAVVTDKCEAVLSSATSTALNVECNITGTATATLTLYNNGTTNAAIDVATGTAQVCFNRN
jgi:hypothetical protein